VILSLYMDVHIPRAITEGLRLRGVDILTASWTRDADVFVAPDEDNVARLRRALKSVFDDDPNVDEITAADLGGDYPAVEYTPPHGR
jgi:hypothetical protein